MKLIKPIKPITIFGDLCHNIFVRYSNYLLIAWIVSVIEENVMFVMCFKEVIQQCNSGNFTLDRIENGNPSMYKEF